LEANQINAKNYPTGRRYRQRYQNAIAQVIKDQPAYDYAKQAHEKLRKNEPKEALRDLDKAILAQNNEFSFWLMRGYAWAMLDNNKNAELAFTTSIIKNPAHYRAYLERGMLLYDQGQRDEGITDIKRSHAILPTAEGSYYLGEQEMAMKNYARAKSYYLDASVSPGKFRELAKQKMMVADQNLNPKKYIHAMIVIVEPAQVGIKLTNLAKSPVNNIQLQVSNGTVAQTIIWNKKIDAKQSVIVRSKFRVGVYPRDEQIFEVKIISANVTKL
jgi:predicted Zn-dependent protease